jgi:hypothetical protein
VACRRSSTSRKRPWIQPENASAEQVAEVVRRCPSGALHYRLEEGPREEPEQPTRVEFVANGPINLRGDLSIDVPLWADAERALLRQGMQPHWLEVGSADPRQRLEENSSERSNAP